LIVAGQNKKRPPPNLPLSGGGIKKRGEGA